jgi:Arc/MetJ-type ribon-helix-helix transcriptional regulator
MRTITEGGGENIPRSKQVMVRLPSMIASSVVGRVGLTHASRPDFVLDATRQYLAVVHSIEYEAYRNVRDKDVSYVAKCEFFQEYISLRLKRVSDECAALTEKSSGKDTDVLLSVPPLLLKDIESTSKRLGAFRNRQDFLRQAVVMYNAELNNNAVRLLEVGSFLEENEDLKKLRDELDGLRNGLIVTKG